MNKALNLCLRSSPLSSTLRCQSASGTAVKRCLAAGICPAARNSAGARRRLQTQTQTQRRRPQTTKLLGSGREYSTREGTIGEGEKGVEREREMLEAPEHLNEKEREIWGLLRESFEPVSLEVYFPVSPFPSFHQEGIC